MHLGLEAAFGLKRYFGAYTEASVLSIWDSKEACESFACTRPSAFSLLRHWTFSRCGPNNLDSRPDLQHLLIILPA
jgi:hypothetical protein